MRFYIKCDKAAAEHAPDYQWSAKPVSGLKDAIRSMCESYNCPYQYRRFRFALDHYDSKVGFSIDLSSLKTEN